jgi:hypothetical protein
MRELLQRRWRSNLKMLSRRVMRWTAASIHFDFVHMNAARALGGRGGNGVRGREGGATV